MAVSSGDQFWRLYSDRSFDDILGPREVLDELRRYFFFEPLPFVSRVVFLATPHRGSDMSRGVVGRVGTSLISDPDHIHKLLYQLVKDNPDAIRQAAISPAADLDRDARARFGDPDGTSEHAATACRLMRSTSTRSLGRCDPTASTRRPTASCPIAVLTSTESHRKSLCGPITAFKKIRKPSAKCAGFCASTWASCRPCRPSRRPVLRANPRQRVKLEMPSTDR